MVYRPKEWECGDTITAEDLNHLEQGVANASGGDCGYSCETTEVVCFDGQLTLSDMGGTYMAEFTPSQPIEGDSVTVTFDGVEYELPKGIESYGIVYGEFDSHGPVFTNYPCAIAIPQGNTPAFGAQNAGTHSVKIKSYNTSATTTSCFDLAVKTAMEKGGDDSEFVYVHINQNGYAGACVMEEDYTGQELCDMQGYGKKVVGIWTTNASDDLNVRISVSASVARGTYGVQEGFDFGFIDNMYHRERVNATHMLVDNNSNSVSITSSKHVNLVDD